MNLNLCLVSNGTSHIQGEKKNALLISFCQFVVLNTMFLLLNDKINGFLNMHIILLLEHNIFRIQEVGYNIYFF
jgi:hypothetical protein